MGPTATPSREVTALPGKLWLSLGSDLLVKENIVQDRPDTTGAGLEHCRNVLSKSPVSYHIW